MQSFISVFLFSVSVCFPCVRSNEAVDRSLREHYGWPGPAAANDSPSSAHPNLPPPGIPRFDRLTERRLRALIVSGTPFILQNWRGGGPSSEEAIDVEPSEDAASSTSGSKIKMSLAQRLRTGDARIPALAASVMTEAGGGVGGDDATELVRTRRESRSENHCFATAIHFSRPTRVRLWHFLSDRNAGDHGYGQAVGSSGGGEAMRAGAPEPHWESVLHPTDLFIYPPGLHQREFSPLHPPEQTAAVQKTSTGVTLYSRALLTSPLPSRYLRAITASGTSSQTLKMNAACQELRRDLAVLGVQFPLLETDAEAGVYAAKLVRQAIDRAPSDGVVSKEEAQSYWQEAAQRAEVLPYWEDVVWFHDADQDGVVQAKELARSMAEFSVNGWRARGPGRRGPDQASG